MLRINKKILSLDADKSKAGKKGHKSILEPTTSLLNKVISAARFHYQLKQALSLDALPFVCCFTLSRI